MRKLTSSLFLFLLLTTAAFSQSKNAIPFKTIKNISYTPEQNGFQFTFDVIYVFRNCFGSVVLEAAYVNFKYGAYNYQGKSYDVPSEFKEVKPFSILYTAKAYLKTELFAVIEQGHLWEEGSLVGCYGNVETLGDVTYSTMNTYKPGEMKPTYDDYGNFTGMTHSGEMVAKKNPILIHTLKGFKVIGGPDFYRNFKAEKYLQEKHNLKPQSTSSTNNMDDLLNDFEGATTNPTNLDDNKLKQINENQVINNNAFQNTNQPENTENNYDNALCSSLSSRLTDVLTKFSTTINNENELDVSLQYLQNFSNDYTKAIQNKKLSPACVNGMSNQLEKFAQIIQNYTQQQLNQIQQH